MRPQFAQVRFAAVLISVALWATACAPDPAAPGNEIAPSISAAKAAPTTDMSVSGATPDSATQDTTLDVVVNGSGFVAGTAANWALAGVQDPGQVRTNSTRYVNSRQLVANITISASATIAKWDIVVTAAGKKGGIGTESFAVKAHGNPQVITKANLVWDDMVNVAPLGQPAVWEQSLLTGDYRDLHGASLANGTAGEYQHGFCGSESYMQQVSDSYPTADLNFDTDHMYVPSSMDGPCGGRRYYQVFFSGRASPSVHVTPQHFALNLATLAVGQSLSEEVHFGVQLSNCAPLRYDDTYPPSNNARVTRLTDTLTVSGVRRRWRVESQGSHRSVCTLNTKQGVKILASYYMPFAYTITEVMAPFPSFP